MPYAITDLVNNTYTGFRMVEAGWVLAENETYAETLDGLTQAPTLITLQAKRQVLVDLFKALPVETRLAFQQVAVTVDTALQLGDVELALANLELAKLVDGADTVLLESMITLIEGA